MCLILLHSQSQQPESTEEVFIHVYLEYASIVYVRRLNEVERRLGKLFLCIVPAEDIRILKAEILLYNIIQTPTILNSSYS